MKINRDTLSLLKIGSVIYATIIMTLLWYVRFPHDELINKEGSFGAFHVVFNIILFCLGLIETIVGFMDLDDKSNKNDININLKMKNKITISIISAIAFIFIVYTPIKSSITLYNQNIEYINQYSQKCTERNGFYDKLWKTYLQKNQIASVNKDVFIKTSQIIMKGRSDGPQTTWKWVAENQNIPFDKFSDFYSDLSSFIQTQREAYFDLEKQCMSIANANNTMLQVFPNNLYNKVIKCKQINYQYGFTSDKTYSVFETKKENLK
jgi:hypothetical protein